MQRPLSLRARLFRRLLGLMRSHFDALSVEESRRSGNLTGFPLPAGTRIQNVDELSAQWIDVGTTTPDHVILYLHGGGYVQNTPKAHHPLIARICAASHRRALYLDYRLAPEHVFPAALDDTIAAYQWLLSRPIPASNIVLAGDSAGGGLAVAAMVKMRDSGLPLPSAAVLLSPFCDLTLSSPGARSDADPIYTRGTLFRAGQLYAGSTPLDHPLLSPINADLRQLPPMLIQAGEVELLRDDALILADRIRAAGGQVTVSIYDGLWHVWQVYPPFIVPESRLAVEEIAAFMRTH